MIQRMLNLKEKSIMGNSMEYLAHIRKEDGEKQNLLDHLKGTGAKSRHFASKIGLEQQGELIGLLTSENTPMNFNTTLSRQKE
jgi:hypothetical protein